jgi:hypothetical protein
VVPPLTVLTALAFDRVFSVPGRLARGAVSVGLCLLALAQTRALVELHPNAYVYFNSLVGGVRGAQGRFELDFWGTSLAEAAHGLKTSLLQRGELPERNDETFKVYVCGNVWSASLFFPPWLSAVDRREDADFQLAINNHFCAPPPGSRRLLEVERAGAVLSYVDELRPVRLPQRPEPSGDPRSVARSSRDSAPRRSQPESAAKYAEPPHRR